MKPRVGDIDIELMDVEPAPDSELKKIEDKKDEPDVKKIENKKHEQPEVKKIEDKKDKPEEDA